MSGEDEKWMLHAIEMAHQAVAVGEVPIGAVVVNEEGMMIAAASNRTISDSDPTAHAEILALRSAGKKIGNYRLVGATVYSTIEPCAMCAGALVNARIKRLVFGALDERYGAAVTHFGICASTTLNHQIEIVSGVLSDQCLSILKSFFRGKRIKATGIVT